VTERLDELAKIISGLMTDTIQRKDFESLLEMAVASRMLFRTLPAAEKQSQTMLSNMEYALNLLIGKEELTETKETEIACSFCGKKRPEVQIGAGADAFICNECVDLFTEIFRLEKEKGGLPNKEV
jgi:hypothetical protein